MKNVTAYLHSHWDREWYRDFEDFRLRLIEVFDEILCELEQGEIPCFYFDGQIVALEDYLEIRNENTERVKKLIKEKKLRVGPFYCSSDSFLVSGESLYRNSEIGLKKAKAYGETDFIAYVADSFGHSFGLTKILKAQGIKRACLWRGLGNSKADLNWGGIEVLYLIQGYFQDFLSLNLPIERKAELLKNYLDKISAKSSANILLPVGADHLGLAKNVKRQIEELNKIYSDYKISIGTPFDYFEKIKERDNVRGEFLDNSLNFILPGVYSTRNYIKQANSQAQWKLERIAEPLNALCGFFYGTKNKQKELDYAYEMLIKNQAHDSIYGCSLDKVHDEMLTRYEKINSVSNGVIKRNLRDIADDDGVLSVFNLSLNNYSGKITVKTEKKLPEYMKAVKISSEKGFTDKKLYNINDIPVTEDYTTINEYLIDVKNLKGLSLTNIKKENINNEHFLKVSKNGIENSNIKIEIADRKIIVTDKIRNEQYFDFIKLTDRADIGDSYNFGALKGDIPVYTVVDKFKIVEKNAIRAVLKLNCSMNIPENSSFDGRSKKSKKHRFNLFATLYNQSRFIEFKLDWENKSKNHILQIGFNLKNKIYKTLNEDLYGIAEREFNPDFDIYSKIPAARGIEIKPATSSFQRFVATQNFLLMTKGIHEYEVNKNTLQLTLLRSTGIISNPQNPTRGTPAGPPLEIPKAQCLGQNTADFAIAFESDEREMFKLTEEFYSPFECVFTNKPDKTFFALNNPYLLLSAIKFEGSDLLIRLYNNSETPQKIEFGNNRELPPKEISNIIVKR